MSTANNSTEQLVDDWVNAKQLLAVLGNEISRAETALSNAKNTLGKRLCPVDALTNEVFSIWVDTEESGEMKRLINVQKVDESTYKVSWYEAKK